MGLCSQYIKARTYQPLVSLALLITHRRYRWTFEKHTTHTFKPICGSNIQRKSCTSVVILRDAIFSRQRVMLA